MKMWPTAMSLRQAQEMVTEFHDKFGVSKGDVPELRDVPLRVTLIAEEAQETCEAAMKGDIVEAADGLCDTIYVCLGAAVTWGIDLSPLFSDVHRANMNKVGGAVRGDGKILKPDGWVPPAIAEFLAAQRRRRP